MISVNSDTHISEYLKHNPSFNIVNIIVTSNGKGIELVETVVFHTFINSSKHDSVLIIGCLRCRVIRCYNVDHEG